MCGIAGWIDLKENISRNRDVIINMTNTLKERGPDDEGYYLSENALLGHRRLVVVDPSGGAQPMSKSAVGRKFIIVYNGELYNTEDLRKVLRDEGYEFDSYSDTEVLLTSYIHWGPECLHHINGIYAFAIWDEDKKSLFMARDPLGVKPLFYTIKNNSLIFGSEIKTILAHPLVEPIVDRQGLTEIFALGPARALGSGVFKNIREVPPANYLLYTPDGVKLSEYWKPQCRLHTEDVETTAEHVRTLLLDAIKRQLVADVPVCCLLSGGLDSSTISAVAASEFKKQGRTLDTYSIDYKDNDKYFEANSFEPTPDRVWALKMSKYINSRHHGIVNDNKALADALYDAVIAGDLPAMADIDSSFYLFFKEIRKKNTVVLSGECADEIFGGYPWYRRPEDINAHTFPWSKSINSRKEILSGELKKLDLEGYLNEQYEGTLKQVPHLDGESRSEARMRELFYLNIKWFMITLLTRKDRMSMANSLEARVPFADYRLVEYAFNIPSEMKFYKGREKGLLRKALKGILPEEIIERKKSPYPKTHNPEYTKHVQKWMRRIMADKSSPILNLIDKKAVKELIDTGGSSFKAPWFGQLMRGPQLLAYLIEINIWLKEYKVKIEF
ncbi:MAG: asparagine synthase (glutamine-hydrolyzing) [Clostridium sp.]|jgi:asparagine synthase (glutamine-hydrolysing)|uniref:asparagine synthase (glutamine-hydrolyzing) n=1 Tax=Clostridium sp. TaxID=1506 RepID=UPI0025B7C859|nr:asparagine synthase (glutamine-hydrolyzing) [Clostridium sp.]MCH3965073.1 asparagine synthase (glutamine-hydrolyzing) [Clostridium sp.]MCI1714294.1 asparagine synthase (glutamine-hydrolyzing) [Clostridium sp.]MCI1798556.1 asparagine synthase (glutamine-hydrolyzing) [Clostridium sp.]MCI1812713.1 asparagine synthase (glutamine-hydrolyzing) [Clostridium sp.]MCI1869365.1 asparagine synthase (glutamine-hydrolyzing) [Clostridium sp.]